MADVPHHQGRLDQRSRAALVPGLWRLLDLDRDAAADARPRMCSPRTRCSSPASAARRASRTT